MLFTMKIRHILSTLAFFSIVGWGPFSFFTSSTNAPVGSSDWISAETDTIHSQASNLDKDIIKLSLTAYAKARRQGFDDKQLLTIVDYSKPSTEKRLWVVDLKNNKVLFNTWVAHGKNSGELNSNSFSNSPRSLKSSLGVFVTRDSYDGHNGLSLRMQGLEHGFNDNAYSRAIVFHGADYANPEVSKGLGRLGRSWGCLAVGRDVIGPLVNTIKHETVVVAYYPDQRWLRHSSYVNA
jgi:hypothetical protein